MASMFKKVAVIAAATGTVVSTGTFAPSANAAIFNLSWEGNNGYYATGSFSFDDALLGDLVTQDDLTSLVISFFNGNNLLQTSTGVDSETNFNFNSATGQILQSGGFSTATGFDLGSNYFGGETGFDFYTFTIPGDPPAVTIVLDRALVPLGCEDGYSLTCDLLSTGGTLTASAVPEPMTMAGLALAGIGGAYVRRRRQQTAK